MHKQYLVIKDYKGRFGVVHQRGNRFVVGDTTHREAIAEIDKQDKAGNLRVISEGRGESDDA